jgi:UPF0716 protein FxsA
MGFLGKIFFAGLIYLFVEIYVFIEVSLRIGFLVSAFLLIALSITGYAIAKRIKGVSLQNAISDYSRGISPGRNLIKSAAFFISGVLFFIPGFVTDVIALLFLIPYLNYYLVYIIFKYFKNKLSGAFSYRNDGGNADGFETRTFTSVSLPFKKKD